MKIDTELDDREYASLLLMMGCAIGIYSMQGNVTLCKTCVRAANKLLASAPDFIPYDESSYDPARERFPFATVKVD